MNDKKLYLRLPTLIIILFTQIRQQILNCQEIGWQISCLDRNKTLTVMTNYLIAIWLILWFLWRFESEKEEKLDGMAKGGLTVYITLVMLAYHFLIAPTDATFYTFSNFSQHYIVPILFIADWILFSRVKYDWKYIAYWSLYPLLYAIFALTNGILGLSSGYIYGFLDPDAGSWSSVITMIVAILIFYMILATIYVFINTKYLTKKDNQ